MTKAPSIRATLNIDVIGEGGKFYPAGAEIDGKMALDLVKTGAATVIRDEPEKRPLKKATLRS